MEWTAWLGRLGTGGRPKDRFGIAKLHATARGGWEWHDRWGEGPRRSLAWGPDRLDAAFLVQGTGDCLIHGATGPRAGQLRTGGLSPVLVVSGFAIPGGGRRSFRAAGGAPAPRWSNLEVTLYAQAGHEALSVTYAGIESVCWPGGPEGAWTGWKFVTRNADGGRSLLVEVWTDRTGARDGGEWRLARSVRLSSECASLETDYSVYIRCDGSEERHFRHLSVREIEPLPGPFPGRSPAAAALRKAARGWDEFPDSSVSRGQGQLPLQAAPLPAGDGASPAPRRPLSEAGRAVRGRLGSLLDGSRAYRPGDWTMGSLAALLLLAAPPAHPQDAAPEPRCDLALQSTPPSGSTRLPGAAGQGGCLDLAAPVTAPGGGGVETAGNATRIERDGIVLCKSAFRTVTPAEADIVFIYDNSGSMWPTHAFVDPIRRDTSFFYSVAPGYSGCFSSDTAGTLTYATRAGARTLPLLKTAAGCRDHAGDPYSARGAVIAAAIDYMARTSPTSSAGTVAFSTRTAWEQPPVLLFDASRAALVKSAIRMDVAGGTAYGPPLNLARRWLRDPTVARTARQAIVFISDGAPADTAGPGAYHSLVDGGMPPIFSIFLGRPGVSDTAKLLDLSRRTGGSFHRVDPGDVAGIDAVMQSIVRSLLITTLPKSIVVTNQGLTPPQASVSVGLRRNPDSSVTVFLDSVLALRRGENDLRFRIVLSDTAVREHALRVRADGAAASGTQGSLRCFDQPSLTLLNPSGYADTAYPMLERTYQAKLTRFNADLDRVALAARTEPAGAAPAPGGSPIDAELFPLRLDPASHGHPAYRNPVRVKGGAEAALPGDGTLQAPRGGILALSWVHPRDPRERAQYRLGGAGTSGAPAFILAQRVSDVSSGAVVAGPIAQPVVIRGGAELRPGGAGKPALAWKGCLWNCGGREELAGDPARTPGFVFKTRAPFAFDFKLYDHLGRFVNSASGRVDAAKWAAMPKVGDSVAVVMSILPVSREGNLLATGAYVVRAVIRTDAAELPDGKGGIVAVAPGVLTLLDKFGYTRL